MSRPPLGIVLVNYARWQDTIECLESVLRSDIDVRVVVVDNASPNDSLARITAWARGQNAAQAASPAMAHFSQPMLPKPIDHQLLGPADLEAATKRPLPRLTIVDSGSNLGFGGGNNIGLKLLLGDPQIRHFWLLNNDTVIAPDTARILDDTMAQTPNIGMAGTSVRFYFRPESVQAWCGYRFSPLTGQAKAIGQNAAASDPVDVPAVLAQVDFILGASLAVSRPFLESVGLMEHRYFLYYEEIDWSVRNRRNSGGPFEIAYADKAIVWHKEGGSIGSSSQQSQRSLLAEYWLTRSRLDFTQAHYPALLPLHWALTLALAARRTMQGRADKAAKLLRALFGRPF